MSNELSLQWFNQGLPAGQQLQTLAVLEDQDLGCMVRSDPGVPTQGVLRALARMKQSGEIERISQRYGGAGYAGNAAARTP
ncbi:hypothetical protein D3C76_1705450 [compost metagenome]